MKNFLAVFLSIFVCVSGYCQTIYLNADGTGDYATIEAAVEAASDYDTIVLNPGIYSGEGNCEVDIRKPLTIRSIDPNDPLVVEQTIVDCNDGFDRYGFHFLDRDCSINGISIRNCSRAIVNASTVNNCKISDSEIAIETYLKSIIVSDCNISNCEFAILVTDYTAAVISDCVVWGNYGNDWLSGIIKIYNGSVIRDCRIVNNSGRAIWAQGDVTIDNCIISNNTTSQKGVVYFEEDSYDYRPIIKYSVISYNSASEGGGIYCHEVYPTIVNCSIIGNYSGSRGGGIYCDGVLKIFNSQVTGNRAIDEGGGIYNNYSLNDSDDPDRPIIDNCIISCNYSSDTGGAIYDDYSSGIDIENTTIAYNYAKETGGISTSLVRGSNTIVWSNEDLSGNIERSQFGNSAVSAYKCCIEDIEAGDGIMPFDAQYVGNIDDDPNFVSIPDDGGDGWGVGDNDYYGDLHLNSGSPCIDAGLSGQFVDSNHIDIDGQERVMGINADIGADEVERSVIVVESPKAGDFFAAGSEHYIKWSAYGVNDTVDIFFSQDSGDSWESLAEDFNVQSDYLWQTPDGIDSSKCMISVVRSNPDVNSISYPSGEFTVTLDYIHPDVEIGWQSVGGEFDRRNLSQYNGPRTGCVKWRFDCDGPITTSATIGPIGRIHLASADGVLYTLDGKDGDVLWSYDTNSPLVGSPTIDSSGTVFTGSSDGRLYAISISGRLRWSFSTGNMVCSSPAVSQDGKVYISSLDGTLYAVDEYGSDLWEFSVKGEGVSKKGSFVGSPAIGSDGTVYISSMYDPNLYALDPCDGSVKWSCNFNPDHNDSHCWAATSPVIGVDGTIYQTLMYDPNLYAIDPCDGSVKFKLNLKPFPQEAVYSPSEPERVIGYTWFGYSMDDVNDYVPYKPKLFSITSPAVGPDGTLYVSYDDPFLRAVDPNGTIKWVTKLGETGNFTVTVGSDGIIYAAAAEGRVHVVDPTGDEIGRFYGSLQLSYPVIYEDGTILVSDVNNTLWAIEDGGCAGEKDLRWYSEQDLYEDGVINLLDLSVLLEDWQSCSDLLSECEYYSEDYFGPVLYYHRADFDKSLYIDIGDLAKMAEVWLIGG